jgi:TPR repeat protein/membrane protease YdiL (CAAX protease family)
VRLLLLVFLALSLAAKPAPAQMLDPLAGRIGIGFARDKTSGFFTIGHVATKSPADLAGIQKNDVITVIDGASTATMTDAEALHACNGTIGTSVALTLRRAGVPDQTLSIPRVSFSNAYLPAAQAGDADAQYTLGFFYEHTLPGLRDYAQAADWYRRAADQGFAPAQVNLATMLRFGLGVHPDLAASTALLQKAAAQGEVNAERDLALRYYYGSGIAASARDAFAWFYAAAQQDDSYAERYLGFLYENGFGTPRDETAAFAWYYAAARHDDPVAERHLGFIYERGTGTDRDDNAAFAWTYAAARHDDAVAERHLGVLYQQGIGTARDDHAAFAWTYASARHGDAAGEQNLGYMYDSGIGVERDNAAAFAWYYAAARQGDAQAEADVASCYLNGRGVGEDDTAAFDWYYDAARHDNVVAERQLGYLYRLGRGVQQSDAEAFAWYHLAATRHDDAISERYLGGYYRLGRGVAQDDKAAFAWYYTAARHDDAAAETNLGFLYQQGRGVARDDTAAFAWYYAGARHDDPSAEQYLGSFYNVGRGTPRDYQAAFAWLYRSAVQHDHYGEWNLSYLYEMGHGVHQDTAQARQWARKALDALPTNERLREHVAILNLRTFLETHDTSAFDLPFFLSVFHRTVVICFLLTAFTYAALGVTLGLFTFRAKGPPHLALAVGWIFFYVESQFVAVFAAFLLGNALTADLLILMIAVWGALPVVMFSLGSNWHRLWKPSTVPWRTLAASFAGCALAVLLADVLYDQLLTFVTGSHLADQSTRALFQKAKEASPWIALSTIGLILPVAEEILFRGYLFDALRKRWPDATTIIVTAFAFAAVHFQLAQFPLLFAMGLVLGWARMKTNSLRLPVLLHAANNSLVMLAAT